MIPELGKYAFYVLSAYGAAFVLLAALILASLRRGRAARAALREIERETRQDG